MIAVTNALVTMLDFVVFWALMFVVIGAANFIGFTVLPGYSESRAVTYA